MGVRARTLKSRRDTVAYVIKRGVAVGGGNGRQGIEHLDNNSWKLERDNSRVDVASGSGEIGKKDKIIVCGPQQICTCLKGQACANPEHPPPPSSVSNPRTFMEENEAIHIDIPPRLYQVPGTALAVGTVIGAVRGSRKEGLRFLAENAHRAPTTVQGWYFYNKTKNYRKILGGLREGGRQGLKLSATAMGWVTIEESIRRFGHEEGAEVGAGVATGAIFGLVCEYPRVHLCAATGLSYFSYLSTDRLGLRTTGQSILLGLLIGLGMTGMRKGKEKLGSKVE